MRRQFPGTSWAIVFCLAAGCAAAPEEATEDDGLLASTPIVHRLPLAEGKVVEVARFSQLRPGGPLADDCEPYVLQPAHPLTRYRPAEVAGNVCVEGDATNGYSALQRLIRISPERHPLLEWSWRVPRLKSDAKAPAGPKDTPRARLMLAFHGDPEK